MASSLENRLRQKIEPFQYKHLIIPQALRHQRRTIRRIRKQGKATVVFIVSSLPMWRCLGLFDLLRADERFDVSLVLYPFPSFTPEQQVQAIDELEAYCDAHDMPYRDLSEEKNPGAVLRTTLRPDILFYQQPYNYLYGNDLDSPFFPDSLICYVPYAVRVSSGQWVFRNRLSETAWRLFYPSLDFQEDASAILYNRGDNIRVTGEPMLDIFAAPAGEDIWKPQDHNKKRVIWAPHFSIADEGLLHRDSFTWLSDCMREMTEQYADRIQFAFKPHPRLFSALCGHPQWGPEKTKAYFKRWEKEANTQLVTGSYVDLFKTSDAMIHDSASFSVEYHLTGKPVIFTTRNLDAALAGQNELGKAGVRAHYLAQSKEDIKNFLDKTVLGGEDPMKATRQAFCDHYLHNPGEGSVAENIYHEILTGLGFNHLVEHV